MYANDILLAAALGEYGTAEVPGEKHSERVMDYVEGAGFSDKIKDDETAWCSTFMNAMCNWNCIESSGSALARSWLKVGEEVETPRQGDIVIFERGGINSWQGHVGIYINERDGNINTLGGNQSNKVSIAPYNKSRVLGFRRLKIIEK